MVFARFGSLVVTAIPGKLQTAWRLLAVSHSCRCYTVSVEMQVCIIAAFRCSYQLNEAQAIAYLHIGLRNIIIVISIIVYH